MLMLCVWYCSKRRAQAQTAIVANWIEQQLQPVDANRPTFADGATTWLTGHEPTGAGHPFQPVGIPGRAWFGYAFQPYGTLSLARPAGDRAVAEALVR